MEAHSNILAKIEGIEESSARQLIKIRHRKTENLLFKLLVSYLLENLMSPQLDLLFIRKTNS